MSEHNTHSGHDHQHGTNCGHRAIQHEGHTDYEHDGHRHTMHEGHVDECRIDTVTEPPGERQAR